MKKIYKSPNSIIMHLQGVQMISASGGVTSNNGIGYGGVDEDGSLEADTKENKSVWDKNW